MAENIAALNLATRAGEGVADVMTWNNLDNTAKQLYAEQKQRELQAAKDFTLADSLLQKEVGGIRSADNDEIFNQYNNLREIRKKIHFDEKTRNNPKELARLQQEAALAERNLRGSIAESKELGKTLTNVTTGVAANPYKFDRNKTSLLPQLIQTPSSKIREIGATTPSFFAYSGADLNKLGQWRNAAMGSAKEIESGVPRTVQGGWKYEKDILSRGNDPVKYFNLMKGNFSTNQAGQSAEYLMSEMTPQEKTQIVTQFNAIPDKDFEEKWGIKKEDLLKNKGAEDDLTNGYLLLDAMKYATDFLPKVTKTKTVENEEFANKIRKQRDDANRAARTANARIIASGKNQVQVKNPIEKISTSGAIKTKSGNEVFVQEGFVTDKSGSEYTGEFFLPRNQVPADIYSRARKQGMNPNLILANEGFTAKVVNGEIVTLTDPDMGTFDADFLSVEEKVNPNKVVVGGKKDQPKPTSNKKVVGKKDSKL